MALRSHVRESLQMAFSLSLAAKWLSNSVNLQFEPLSRLPAAGSRSDKLHPTRPTLKSNHSGSTPPFFCGFEVGLSFPLFTKLKMIDSFIYR
jgi:hypothetical protein